MYTDTALFIISATGLLILIASIIYLISSSKKSKTFKRFIKEETEYNTIKSGSTFINVNSKKTKNNSSQEYISSSGISGIISGIGASENAGTILGNKNNNYEGYTVSPHTDNNNNSDNNNNNDDVTLPNSQSDILEFMGLFNSDTPDKDTSPPYEINSGSGQDLTEKSEKYENSEKYEKPELEYLDGRYEIEKAIYSGSMSKVYIARNDKVGRCIIKFITHDIGKISYEHETLKNLYHIHLPKIIDIFTNETGIYLVESYIEGRNLGDIIKDVAASNKVFNPSLIIDWAKQLCDVYSYLHNLPDSPIYHFDIKPENIMVTHGDSLVPIDFGISKRANDGTKTIGGLSPKYAAPEQFGDRSHPRYKKLMDFRFGDLPENLADWKPDARTDIFSFGTVLFELAVGEIPNAQNISKLKNAVSSDFAKIILKCIKINPDERYQTMDQIAADLQNLNIEKIKIHRSMLMRKITATAAAFSFFLSGSSFAGGSYIYQQENLALLEPEPQFVTISLQQSSDLKIEKQMPNGDIIVMNPNDVKWSSESDHVAQVDGSRIAGINIGKTTIYGKYRNKLLLLEVNIVEPMDGMVDIVQKYERGHKVTLFGGTLEREHTDGSLDGEAEFVSPESIDIAYDGTVYIADSGILRRIRNNQVESIDIEPFYMTPKIVRCNKNDVYILTNEWEETDGSYHYGIIRVKNDGAAEEIYITDAVYTAIEDFGFAPGNENNENLLYFIERNAGAGEVYLKTINLQNTEDIYTLSKLPEGTQSLAFGEDDMIYLANPETGAIQYYNYSSSSNNNNSNSNSKEGELKYFTGVENEKAFIDGRAPLFYMPQKIKYAGNFLYVWDFNVLRKIKTENGIFIDCMTLAGEASPEFDLENIEKEYDAENIILANSHYTDFVVYADGGILLTDPKRGVIWQIN